MTRHPDRRGGRREDKSGSHNASLPAATEEVRLNRYIARSGVCSRRKADELIAAGLVEINGAVVTELGSKVGVGDQVRVNGSLISPTRHVHILLNKPRDTITTTRDDRGRKTVLDLVNIEGKDTLGIFPVGRLDRDTTGVLLLTNDGELANRLMHPRYEIEKLYIATTDRPMTGGELVRLREGVEIDGETVAADYVDYQDVSDHSVVGISLHEGRNRQIRRMIEAVGFKVEKLDRVRYAGLTAAGLRRGRWRRLKDHEIKRLYRAVKLKTK